MARAALLYRNLADSAVLSAGSSSSRLPPALLQDPQLGVVWRSALGTSATWLLADLGAARSIDTVVLLNSNLSASATRRLRLSTSDATGAAGDVHDSGTGLAGIDPDYGAFFALRPAPVTCRYVRLDLADASLDWLEAGRLIIGRRWQPERNFRTGWARGVIDASEVTETRGGDEWIEERPSRRLMSIELPALTQAEYREHGVQIEAGGIKRDILLISDPDSDNLGRDSIWGRPSSAPVFGNAFLQHWSWPLEIVERR